MLKVRAPVLYMQQLCAERVSLQGRTEPLLALHKQLLNGHAALYRLGATLAVCSPPVGLLYLRGRMHCHEFHP